MAYYDLSNCFIAVLYDQTNFSMGLFYHIDSDSVDRNR